MKLNSRSRTLSAYPRDIIDRVLKQYEADAIGQVHLWLEDLAQFEDPGSFRLARCALYLADGSISKLDVAVKQGLADFRNLIVAAEYDRADNRLRNMNLPFE
jgi:hypothetical protein